MALRHCIRTELRLPRLRQDGVLTVWDPERRYRDLRLALALWSARVVEKCAANVELAEGHEVRRFLWVRRGEEGVWRRRKGIADARERAIRLARKI